MTTVCNLVEERLLELLEEPDASDPEEVILAPLRQHLMACSACQVEAAELRGFLRLDREAVELLPDEAEFALLEAGMATRRDEFLEFVRTRARLSDIHDPGACRSEMLLDDVLDRLRKLSASRRIELLKQAVSVVLQRRAPAEMRFLGLLWQTSVSHGHSSGRSGSGWGPAAALGAVGGGEEQTLKAPALIELALWLDRCSSDVEPTGADATTPPGGPFDEGRQLLREVLDRVSDAE